MTQNLKATTGFADFIYYTSNTTNVYYYPVLGQLECSDVSTSCTSDSDKLPQYVQFSVPSNISHGLLDATTLEWYQPVHEPGNVLSYPISKIQLQAQFPNTIIAPYTADPPTCRLTDTSTSQYSSQWKIVTADGTSNGTANAFSDQVSMSVSGMAGIKDVIGGSLKFTVSVGGSLSLNTLNEDFSSLSASQGITVNKPSFSSVIADCCGYAYAGYVYGLRSTKHPPGQDPSDVVTDPDGKAITGESGPGPLFVGFLADVRTDLPNGLNVCTGNTSWWTQVYNKPNVALNHPARWSWTQSTQTLAFNAADQSGQSAITGQPFYQMKGFFITKQDAPMTGQNLTVVTAGDQLVLTTRVYNYSLVGTTAPVHVRIYGQRYCASNQSPGCSTCPTIGGVCGSGFLIGETQIASIPGYKSSPADGDYLPNWTTASVNFDTTQYSGTNLSFWVVVWMQDANGNLVSEMPDHGLAYIPSANISQLTDVPIEAHSDNVGFYGAHSALYIAPQNTGLSAEQSSGALRTISLTANPKAALEQRTHLRVNLQATGAPVDNVNIAYFDGDPARGGTLLDSQMIQHMDPGISYGHDAYFRPQTCGVHTLYTNAWLGDSPAISSSTAVNVTVQPGDLVQAIIKATQGATFTDPQTQSGLLSLLNAANQAYQQGQPQAAETILSLYMQQVAATSGSGLDAGTAKVLVGQAAVLLGCGSNGFLLSALPNTATVNSGSNATFALGVTPSGGFTGSVKLSCIGAPAGASCSISSQSVVLDGVNQSQLTVTVSTDSGATMAGVVGGWPVSMRSVTMRYILLILASLFAIGLLGKARRRSSFISCMLALIVLGGAVGCGSNAPASMTPAGTYTLVVQGISGSAVQNATLVLTVQ